MERLPTWVYLFVLSIIIIAAAVDQFDNDGDVANKRGPRIKYVIATAIISLLFAFFFILANLIDRLGNVVVGNKIENAMSAIVVALWIVAISFIQNPVTEAATKINEDGQEQIIYANFYFFSWLNFIAALYLFGNVIRDNLSYNPKFSQWVLLFAASVVLCGTAVAVHDDVCDRAEEVICGRLKYAVAVGSLGITFSLISILATMFGFMRKWLEALCSVLTAIFYFFGVVVLTTADGPANTMGNMYFSVWGGMFCSFALVLGILFPNRSSNGEDTIDHSHNPEENI